MQDLWVVDRRILLEMGNIGKDASVDSLLLVLGDASTRILETLELGQCDRATICHLTGLPEACIEGRIPVLEALGLATRKEDMLVLEPGGRDVLRRLKAM